MLSCGSRQVFWLNGMATPQPLPEYGCASAQPDNLPQQRRDAKLSILAAFEDFCDRHNLNICEGRFKFAELYNSKAVAVADWVRNLVNTISVPTLFRWQKLLKSGLNALAGRWGKHRLGKGMIDSDPEVREIVEGMLLYRSDHIAAELRCRFPDKRLPSLRTIEGWVKRWKEKHPQEWALLQSKHLFNSKFRAAHGVTSEDVYFANQRWEIDATKGDIVLSDNSRYSILLIEDIFSRRLKAFVTKNSNAKSLVRGLLRRTILDWGLADELEIVTDRGKEFICPYFLGSLESLNIAYRKCDAFSPWQKPHIERSFGTLTRELLERLPGFCGHSVAERQLLRARGEDEVELLLTPEELQQRLDGWCAEYEQTAHRGLENRTPIQRWAESPKPIKKITDERALDILLAEVPDGGGLRVVQKRGIQVNNAWFADSEGQWALHIGETVQVKFDPFDAGTIYIFEPGIDGEFLFIATNSDLLGESRQEKAQAAHTMQQQVKSTVRSLKKLADKVKETSPIVAGIAQIGNLVAFPLQAQSFDSQGLRAAQEALVALQQLESPRIPEPLTEEQEAARQVEIKRLEELEVAAQAESATDRYRRLWFAKQQRSLLAADDALFMERYERTPGGKWVKQTLEAKEADGTG
ncbi:MAG: DDE-type integrase/transposase/recombinase [Crinalium sp.]